MEELAIGLCIMKLMELEDWTSMGIKPITVFTDTYVESMRMCYNIVRQYDENQRCLLLFLIHGQKNPTLHGIPVK